MNRTEFLSSREFKAKWGREATNKQPPYNMVSAKTEHRIGAVGWLIKACSGQRIGMTSKLAEIKESSL